MPESPRCAYCRERPVEPAHRPFCSERCRMADLGRWITGGYRFPGDPVDRPDADEPDDQGLRDHTD